jgi:hypothetical protein
MQSQDSEIHEPRRSALRRIVLPTVGLCLLGAIGGVIYAVFYGSPAKATPVTLERLDCETLCDERNYPFPKNPASCEKAIPIGTAPDSNGKTGVLRGTIAGERGPDLRIANQRPKIEGKRFRLELPAGEYAISVWHRIGCVKIAPGVVNEIVLQYPPEMARASVMDELKRCKCDRNTGIGDFPPHTPDRDL